MVENVKERETVFIKIKNAQDLKLYLDDESRRLANKDYLYHYTTLSSAINILKNKCWHLCKAEDMNDRMEYINGDPQRWNRIFFASFMADAKESIGMWSMYSQPWEKGVKIAIPRKVASDWLNATNDVFEVSKVDYQLTGKKVKIESGGLRLSSVAYSNSESRENMNAVEELTWSNQTNRNFLNATKNPELTGYVKDKAWEYEKEVRLKAEFDDIKEFTRVAIMIPDDVLTKMIISAGPLFEGNLYNELVNATGYEFKADNVKESLFTGKLKIKSTCNTCPYRVTF